MQFNREQVRFICEEMAKIRAIPHGSEAEGKVPSERESPRRDALDGLARKLATSDTTLRKLARGEVAYARPWVVEWVREHQGALPRPVQSNGAEPAVHVPVRIKGTRIPEGIKTVARQLSAQGKTHGEIGKLTGIPRGSLTYILRGKPVQGTVGVKPRPRIRPAAKLARDKRPEDWGENFKAYVEAEEEKSRAALTERHERERRSLEEELVAKRQTVINRLLELYTTPEASNGDGD